MKEKLNNNDYSLKYVFASIDEFYDKIEGKVDVLLLSNIFSYYKENQKVFYKIVKQIYEKKLNVEGVIQLTSTYDKFCRISRKKLKKTFKNSESFIIDEGKRGFDSLFLKKIKKVEDNEEMDK